MKALNVTLVVAIAMVTGRAFFKEREIPRPEYFVWIAVVWALLGLVAELGAEQLAAIFSVGFVLAMAYVYFQNDGKAVGRAEKETSSNA